MKTSFEIKVRRVVGVCFLTTQNVYNSHSYADRKQWNSLDVLSWTKEALLWTSSSDSESRTKRRQALLAHLFSALGINYSVGTQCSLLHARKSQRGLLACQPHGPFSSPGKLSQVFFARTSETQEVCLFFGTGIDGNPSAHFLRSLSSPTTLQLPDLVPPQTALLSSHSFTHKHLKESGNA